MNKQIDFKIIIIVELEETHEREIKSGMHRVFLGAWSCPRTGSDAPTPCWLCHFVRVRKRSRPCHVISQLRSKELINSLLSITIYKNFRIILFNISYFIPVRGATTSSFLNHVNATVLLFLRMRRTITLTCPSGWSTRALPFAPDSFSESKYTWEKRSVWTNQSSWRASSRSWVALARRGSAPRWRWSSWASRIGRLSGMWRGRYERVIS